MPFSAVVILTRPVNNYTISLGNLGQQFIY